jgi:hypothetical protein
LDKRTKNMKNIKVDIKKIVSENLQKTRKERFEEAFKNAHSSKNENEFLKNVIVASSVLISEGYEISEIDDYIGEQSLVGSADDALEKVKNADWGKIGRESIMNSIKEYAIRWFLSHTGLNQRFSEVAAMVLTRMGNPLDVLKPFKDSSGCSQYMPKIAGSIMIAFARELAGETLNVGQSNTASTVAGNIFGDSIEESNLPTIISGKFCKMIHG